MTGSMIPPGQVCGQSIANQRPMNAFGRFVRDRASEGTLVLQPRMGVSDPERMRAGLAAVSECRAATVGTITLDSFTRVGDHQAARNSVEAREPLNGFPLVAHGSAITRRVVSGIQGPDFPQVRHGSATPVDIFEEIREAGLDASEGGPVSYCLPYSRRPLAQATESWRKCSQIAAPRMGHPGLHLETFGGCMLGQLCPPSLLIALSVLEGMFFAQNGVRSLSLSFAQQIHPIQDVAALRVLRRLADDLILVDDLHLVLYAFMGVYPSSELGSYRLLADSVSIARSGAAERLIVKTPAEAHRIPTFSENVAALQFAHAWRGGTVIDPSVGECDALEAEARSLIETTLTLHDDIGTALVRAFDLGLLDVPYCLHPDNANLSRASVDKTGRLSWSAVGAMPLTPTADATPVNSHRLLSMLEYNRSRYDRMTVSGWRPQGAIA